MSDLCYALQHWGSCVPGEVGLTKELYITQFSFLVLIGKEFGIIQSDALLFFNRIPETSYNPSAGDQENAL